MCLDVFQQLNFLSKFHLWGPDAGHTSSRAMFCVQIQCLSEKSVSSASEGPVCCYLTKSMLIL